MDKFDRSYSINLWTKFGEKITLGPPFTIEFDIHRNTLSSASIGSFRIYNLAKDTREKIRKDAVDTADLSRRLEFTAGYVGQMSMAFKGNMSQAWSVREGSNFITQIECFDAADAFNTDVPSNYPTPPAGTTKKEVIKGLIDTMDQNGVSRGVVSEFKNINNEIDKLTRGRPSTGKTVDAIKQIAGENSFFIDNGIAHCLADGDRLDIPVPKIDLTHGLLATPVRHDYVIEVQMLFEPSLMIGQAIELESTTASFFTGQYKVMALKHRGTISGSICGTATTTVTLSSGSFTPVGREGF